MMYWWDDHMDGWGYALTGLGLLVFLALLIFAIVLGIRAMQPDRRSPGARPSPQQLLGERFARGEIDDAEYQRRLTTLAEGARDVPHP